MILFIHAQDSLYSSRLILNSLDTTKKEVCYNLQIRNAGSSTITVNAFLFNLYYDPSIAIFKEGTLLVSPRIYSNTIRTFPFTNPGDIQNSGLPFESDSIALIRVGINSQARGIGITLPPKSEWVDIMTLCFDILIEDITSPSSCLQISFHNDMIGAAFVAAGGGRLQNDFIIWVNDTLSKNIEQDSTFDILPMSNRTSCFVINEAEHRLCDDGLDNDEDGVSDCDDCDCGPGSVRYTTSHPTCAHPMGMISIFDAKSGAMFSIDGGTTFHKDSVFTGLKSGSYEIVVRMNDIISCQYAQIVRFDMLDCEEFDFIACTDGIDNDQDGLIDYEDDGCCPEIMNVFVDDPGSCPALDDGQIDIIVSNDQIVFSIDSGDTYSNYGLFTDLSIGSYQIAIRDTVTGCVIYHLDNPVTLTDSALCPEDCSDNIDNDLDGLIDCMDADCQGLSVCIEAPDVIVSNIIAPNTTMNQTMTISSDQDISFVIKIFDRQGSLVYYNPNYTTDSSEGWTGRSTNSGAFMSGVYVYHIHYQVDRETYDLWGDITVIY